MFGKYNGFVSKARVSACMYFLVSHYFYYAFYAMEDSGILNTNCPLHMFALHLVYLPRINLALQEFAEDVDK